MRARIRSNHPETGLSEIVQDIDGDGRDRARRRVFVALTLLAVLLWLIAAALPTLVLVLIGQVPGGDPERSQRAVTIATGGFLTGAIPATATTVALVLLRRRYAPVRRVSRDERGPGSSTRRSS